MIINLSIYLRSQSIIVAFRHIACTIGASVLSDVLIYGHVFHNWGDRNLFAKGYVGGHWAMRTHYLTKP